MNTRVRQHFDDVLYHLYINPLEKCNLRCEICYTRKTNPILSEKDIKKFVNTYQAAHVLKSITFCGGEVFTLPYFPHLVNALTAKRIFIQIVTNGTIDKLDEFHTPNAINIIVSIDGSKQHHDQNRGKGNFAKSIHFLKRSLTLGFHAEIFSIVTKQNFPHIDEFEKDSKRIFGQNIPITYHPRKPPFYLMHHPTANIVGKVTGFNFLGKNEMMQLLQTKKTFPPKDLGCFQIALASDGRVYGCCEGVTPIGTIHDDMQTLFQRLYERLVLWDTVNRQKKCLGCTSPEFVCGMKQYLSLL